MRRRAPLIGLAGAVLLVELGAGAALADPRLERLLVLVAAVLGLAFVFTFPLASCVGLMFVAASIFHGSYFTWSLGPIDIHLEELIFVALAVVAVVAPRRHTWGGAAGAALAVFLGSVALAGCLGVQAGRVSASDAIAWARPLMFYGSFWLVLRLFPNPRELRTLLVAGLACGALTGALALVLQFSSTLIDSFQGTGGQQIYTQAAEAGLGGLRRIREPGLAFSYLLFWWSVVAVIAARPRPPSGAGHARDGLGARSPAVVQPQHVAGRHLRPGAHARPVRDPRAPAPARRRGARPARRSC